MRRGCRSASGLLFPVRARSRTMLVRHRLVTVCSHAWTVTVWALAMLSRRPYQMTAKSQPGALSLSTNPLPRAGRSWTLYGWVSDGTGLMVVCGSYPLPPTHEATVAGQGRKLPAGHGRGSVFFGMMLENMQHCRRRGSTPGREREASSQGYLLVVVDGRSRLAGPKKVLRSRNTGVQQTRGGVRREQPHWHESGAPKHPWMDQWKDLQGGIEASVCDDIPRSPSCLLATLPRRSRAFLPKSQRCHFRMDLHAHGGETMAQPAPAFYGCWLLQVACRVASRMDHSDGGVLS